MSKKKSGRKSRPGSPAKATKSVGHGRTLLKAVGIVGILLTAMVAFGAFVSQRSSNEYSAGRVTSAPMPTPQYGATAPVKEYVYAGSKLLAVSEPVQPAPNDLAVWRLSTGTWYVVGDVITQQTWGVSTDKPAPGDYDGDGKTDFCVYRPSETKWYIILSGTNTADSHLYGGANDIPVPADFDGDGRTDYALYRPSDQKWYVKYIGSQTTVERQYGESTDKPIPSDFDGDGKADMALWRNSNATWYVWESGSNSPTSFQWGSTGDTAVPGDFDGDLKTDYAVWTSANIWSIRQSSTGTAMTNVAWGYQASDIAVQGDYDSDGKSDRAVWRPSNGTWYILKSSNGNTRTQAWGESGDIPVPAPYRR